MAFRIAISKTATKELSKLDRSVAEKIFKEIDVIASLDNPRSKGKPLTGDKAGYWRYRVGDYRIICDIVDEEIKIMIVRVRHRRNVYNRF